MTTPVLKTTVLGVAVTAFVALSGMALRAADAGEDEERLKVLLQSKEYGALNEFAVKTFGAEYKTGEMVMRVRELNTAAKAAKWSEEKVIEGMTFRLEALRSKGIRQKNLALTMMVTDLLYQASTVNK